MPLLETKGAASAQGFGAFAQQAAGTQAQAIDFDGTNDYLSRSTDLTGNTDSKTFTFGFWVWLTNTGSNQYIYDRGSRFVVYVTSAGAVAILGYNTSGLLRLNATTAANAVAWETFINITISIDLANTANRYLYLNDVAQSVTWSNYINDTLNFAGTNHYLLAATSSVTSLEKGRASNVFLDYTYRDLSVTANRRLFVTADLKPAAGQAALNPIMYLPMSDPTQPGLNQGTGGNFTLNGVVARSGRGPNQYNAPLSSFASASSQTLFRAINLTTTNFTLAFSLRPTTTGSLQSQISYYVNSNSTINLFRTTANGNFVLRYFNGSSDVWTITLPNTSIANRNYNIVISNSSTSSHVSVNGVVTTSSGISSAIPINGTLKIMGDHNVATRDGIIGALWFNTSYIDLSVAANLAKFVTGTGINAYPVDLGASGELPTGTSPLIYLPMYANNAGKNYGTGGDFTVNSGPYTGARGPNEFWGNQAVFNTNPLNFLNRSSGSIILSGVSTLSLSFYIRITASPTAAANILYSEGSGGPAIKVLLGEAGTSAIDFYMYDSLGTEILHARCATLTTGINNHVCAYFDLSNSTKRGVYVNGAASSTTYFTYTNSTAGSSTSASIGNGVDGLNSRLSEVYVTNTYIDFSQEANRLKFRDAFGNPTDLPSAITALSVPNPPIYMRFPPTSFGTNSGTGGNFTVNGTITDGGQL
jgi:hypothetical protein